jgi:hypothetical protein
MKRKLVLFILLVIVTISISAQYQLLDVDGIEVTIDEIRFSRGYEDSDTVASISVGQTVNLTGQLSDVFSAAAAIKLEFGEDSLSFDTISIQLVDGVGIKGHTYIDGSDTHVYTSAAGIKKLVGQGAAWLTPADYDYSRNQHIYYEGDEGETIETTFLGSVVTFTSSDTIDIELLVDTFQVAYYWDGQENTRHGFVRSWNQENTAYFPTGTEVIGISYLPLYLSVNKQLTAETYVVAESTADLTPASGGYYNQKRTMTATLVFDQSGAFFIGRTANWDGLDVSWRLPQFVTDATAAGTDYDLILESYENGWLSTSEITGFTRLTVGASDTATYVDDSGSTMTIEYKRVK